MLQAQQKAPDFTSVNENNESISLSDFKDSKNIVLYFYPKDDTTGCTIEANQFTALANEFEALDTVMIGVSKDDCASHQAFIEKYKLKLMLLADTTGELTEAYDVWQEKEKNGVKKMTGLPETFIIDKQGIIREKFIGPAEWDSPEVVDMLTKYNNE